MGIRIFRKIIPEFGSLFVILPYETETCRYRAICTHYCFELYQLRETSIVRCKEWFGTLQRVLRCGERLNH